MSKEPGALNFSDPSTDGAYTYHSFASNPLFSDAGPRPDDVIQGDVGDCYFLSVLSSVAKVDPMLIKQSIVDLGDGTFAVQFTRDEKQIFIRVDADLATTRADVNGVVRRRLNAKKASFAPMDDAVALSGMEYGGITPIGLPDSWPVLIDAAVLTRDVVVIGSGLRRSKLALPSGALADLPGAEVIDGLAG